MTRKDYNQIAATINCRRFNYDDRTLDCIAEDLANVCEKDNPQFDRARFLIAAGVDLAGQPS